MTPKLRLREQARKALLSWIRKCFCPGNRRTNASTQMMVAPKEQAEKVRYGVPPENRVAITHLSRSLCRESILAYRYRDQFPPWYVEVRYGV